MKSLVSMIAVFFFVVSTANAQPIIVTVPTDLNPGDQYRIAFVTSTTHNATSTDIGVYNSFVDAIGDTIIESDWTAIASTAAVSALINTSTDPSPAGPTHDDRIKTAINHSRLSCLSEG